MSKNNVSQLFGEQLLKTAMKNAVRISGEAENGIADMVENGEAGNGIAITRRGESLARSVKTAVKVYSDFFNLKEGFNAKSQRFFAKDTTTDYKTDHSFFHPLWKRVGDEVSVCNLPVAKKTKVFSFVHSCFRACAVIAILFCFTANSFAD